MLRGENILCGTSTTGTGTLTLASPPAPPGGVDPYTWLSLWYSSGGVHLIPYKIVEYTDSTFATFKQAEQGIGTITLGASLTATTLARTTVLETQTNAPAYNTASPSAISIGTAANVLVFMGAGASDVMQANPYYETSLGDAVGFFPDRSFSNALVNYSLPASTPNELFIPFRLSKPLQVKRASMYVSAGGGTGCVSTAYFRIYEIGANGRPGRLLIDLGAIGGPNPLINTGMISTALASPGVFLPPGDYFASFYFTGATSGSGNATISSSNTYNNGSGVLGSAYQFNSSPWASGTGGTNPAPDPASLTGYSISVNWGGPQPLFTLNNA
jgi:hypothetical protein